MREWISVKDKPPYNEGVILLFDRYRGVCIGDSKDDGFLYYDNGVIVSNGCVTHWQPLPEEPKAE